MKLQGAPNQSGPHPLYRADGTIASATAPQLVLPATATRTILILQNLSAATMNFDFGLAVATATLTSGAVSGVTVSNGGFGFTYPPRVVFLGGGASNIQGSLAGNQPGSTTPQNPATGHAVLSGGAISSVVIDNPGSGYLTAPYVLFQSDPRDPFGCVSASATSGFQLAAGGVLRFDNTACPTDPISVFCGTVNSAFLCRWMD